VLDVPLVYKLGKCEDWMKRVIRAVKEMKGEEEKIRGDEGVEETRVKLNS